jgi:hypothetical protein
MVNLYCRSDQNRILAANSNRSCNLYADDTGKLSTLVHPSISFRDTTRPPVGRPQFQHLLEKPSGHSLLSQTHDS